MPAGGGSVCGMPERVPGGTASRNTLTASSVIAIPNGLKILRVWVATMRVPVLPLRSCTSENDVSRRSESPTRMGV